MTILTLPRTAVIGLGAMGAPMARHLAKAGCLSGVGNRSLGKAEQLASELGVAVFATPADAVANSEVLLTCISADQDILSTLAAIRPLLRAGFIWIDTSTVAPATARTAGAALKELGAHFIDAPVSGGVEGAINASLSIMLGGESAVVAQVRPLLDLLGKRVTHLGPVGSGQATKAVNQVLVAGIAQAVSEGLAFAEAQGLDPQQVTEVLMAGAASNWFLGKRAPTMLANEFNLGFKSELLLKDLRICLDIARELRGSLPTVSQAEVDYAELVRRGFGAGDISGLIRLRRERLGG
jgi:3-hydroxyisobutyrate dehydrogenase